MPSTKPGGKDFCTTQESHTLGAPSAVFLGGGHPPEFVPRLVVGGRRKKGGKSVAVTATTFIFFKNQTEDCELPSAERCKLSSSLVSDLAETTAAVPPLVVLR